MSEAPTSRDTQSVPPPDDAHVRSASDHRERRIDIASALLLSIATVLAAWSAFQSAKWGGEQATSYAEASSTRQESVRESTLAGQQTIIDVSVFMQFVDAYRSGDMKLADFYRERARKEFRPVLNAWIALDPIKNSATAPPTPFQMPQYRLAATEASDRLQEQAEAKFQQALQDNRRSDNYVLLAVLFASVLLFAGLAPKSRSYPIQVAMVSLAAVVLAVGVAFLLAFPKTF
jgi:hypothetical protein